ncbi:MAG: response regulator [bacterium]|jgi:CheY-like chemotaxis protein|nr:response regulator [bacterium]
MKTILLVDDDELILEIGKYALQTQGGFAVFTEKRGKRVLETVRQVKPDLILLDGFLEDIDGKEVLAALKQDPECRDLPVIMLTGIIDPKIHETLLATGAIGIILKPFDPLQLAQQINEIIQTH